MKVKFFAWLFTRCCSDRMSILNLVIKLFVVYHDMLGPELQREHARRFSSARGVLEAFANYEIKERIECQRKQKSIRNNLQRT